MRTTILGWSTLSGIILGFIAGLLVFAVLVIGGELLAGFTPRLGGRTRVVAAVLSFVMLPLAGAVLGWLEGRLKLQ